MGNELLKMADGFAMVAESLWEMVGQAVAEAKTEEKQEQKVAVEDIRAVLAEKSQDGKSKGIKELLGKYGVAKLSAVEEKDYPALLGEAKVGLWQKEG